jgi:hypothetical protein
MVPVALFVYNRPFHLERVLDGLKENNIDLLYIFSDAPVTNNAADAGKVNTIRGIITKINWCRKEVFESSRHKGVDAAILEGISVVLAKHDKIIVLEDDCLPRPDFYNYMCQCLDYYEKENKIACISAFLPPIGNETFRGYPYDVFFWQRFWSWGWGSWRRVWKDFNPDLEAALGKIKLARINTTAFGRDVSLRNLGRLLEVQSVPWDAPFFLNMLLNNQFAVYPKESRIRNIGLDGSGAHCTAHNLTLDLKLGEVKEQKRLIFPASIRENPRICREILKLINFRPHNLNRRLLNAIRRLLWQ